MSQNVNFGLVLKEATKLPLVRIDRADYLKQELSKYYRYEIVEKAIKYNPGYAGISVHDIDKIAKAAIANETMKVSSLSFIAGIPGGFAMLGTVPADLVQYFGHILRILQKLIYLYGWNELFAEDGAMDDTTEMLLTLFVGVMFGVNGAVKMINKISETAAQRIVRVLPQKALTKGMIYPIVKKIGLVLGIKIKKEIFAKWVGKMIPILGAFISGGLTLFSFRPMAKKLQVYLSGLPQASVEFYMNNSNFTESTEEMDKEFIEKIKNVLSEDEMREEKEME